MVFVVGAAFRRAAADCCLPVVSERERTAIGRFAPERCPYRSADGAFLSGMMMVPVRWARGAHV
ncbi:MAG: hypothetical protein LBJ07_05005 [Actinomycetes bacterium]|nr:hypothetical protein [Actinomycetes bacterium]